jgi:pyruvate,water dikinase
VNVTAESEAAVGGKAAVLRELRDAGFRVPEFVVSPPDLAAAVADLGFPLAVRSSACVEDGPAASFAGQFRSFLGLWSLEEVEEAARLCRESAASPAVAEYCRRNGIDPSGVRMGVIVQRMLDPELAGVAFTVNPVTGAEEVVIEACAGVADNLLAGRVRPLPADHLLLRRHAGEVAAVARRIQRHFGAPQDVEFAVAGGLVHVLQARPITRIGFAPELGEWTNADFRDGGVSSRVCSPLMWSLYELVWDHTLKESLRRLHLWEGDFQAARLFFGRPYWNLGAVKRSLRRLPGYVEREFDADLSVEPTYEGDGERTPITPLGVLRALPTALALRSFFARQRAEAERWLGGAFDALERRYDAPTADRAGAFRALVEQDYFAVETCYFRTVFAASLAKMDFKTSFPDADYAALVAGLPPLRHMGPVRELREMARRGERDVSGLLRRYRHNCRLGIDVLHPRWDEDRAFVEELAARASSTGEADPRPGYEQALADALGRLPWWRRGSFRRKLERLRAFVWLREEMRDLSSRTYYLIRRSALALAAKRGLGEDVFFLSFREVFADDRRQVDRNREVYDSYRHFRAPNEIGARYRFQAERSHQGRLVGIGASPGTARGPARVARSVEEALRAERGAVLVCPFTDPGWTPALDRAAAVVTETGGLLSHAAVICREYGIPAVLGVPAATERLREGRPVVVHGGEGYVEGGD